MDLDRFAHAERLFHDALERPHEARAAFLDEACAGDDALRNDVLGLLNADAEDDTGFILDEPLMPVASSLPVVGRRVGPYTLVRELGRGGMGTVYLARRDDVEREVALKVVRGDLADPLARRRFLFERRVLARLSHPGIARLYNAGIADDGTPYFAMEYVEGEPITAYCDRHQLGVEARLQLFERVARTVQHAHSHFVVHRDLKPSNILITEDTRSTPRPVLLDFGIAKVLDDAELDNEDLTATGRQLLTPGYAAPEQHEGGPITAATDVYGLGAVLYELLAGTRPGDDPSRPSTAVTSTQDTEAASARGTTADRLARRLRGDLDVICETALQPDPERRYATAEALADDVRRHLDGLPVTAQRDTTLYRMRSFVRRHRHGVWTSAAVASVLIGLTGLYTVRLQTERDRAQTEARKAERVSAFLTDLFGTSNPYEEVQGDTLRARDLLARGAARIESELADEPEVQASMFEAIGDVYVRLGLLDDAQPLLEKALAVRRSEPRMANPGTASTLRRLAWIHMERGDFATADSLGQLARTVEGPDARTLEAARLHYVLGTSRFRQGDFPAADSLHQLADGLFRELAGPDDDETVSNLAQLAHVAEALGDDSLAVERAQAVLDSRRRVYGDEHPYVAEALNDVAFTLRKQGRYTEAEPLYRESIAIKRRLLGDDHPAVATSLNNLGVLFGISGRYDEVGPLFEEALAIRRARYGDVHPAVASTLSSLSMLAISQNDPGQALAHQDEALAILRQVYGGDHPSISSTLINQAQVYYMQDRFREAERIYREALAMEQRLRGGDHEQVAKALNNVGASLVGQGRYDEAEPTLEDALAMYERVVGPEHAALAAPLRHLGRIETARGRYTEAEQHLTSALRLQTDHLGPDHPEIVPTREALAALYDAWGRPQVAARYREAG